MTDDPGAAEHLGSQWPRFSAYSVSKSPLLTIRPTSAAELELMTPGEADRTASSEDQRPYKQLLRMAQRAPLGSARFDMPKRERQQLEQWVRHNGLLGILPHEMLSYRTAAHWHETPIEEEWSDSPKRGLRRLRPYQIEVRRVAGDWLSSYHRAGGEYPLRTARRGDLADDAMLDASALPAETLYRTWPRGEVVSEHLGHRFEMFFPAKSLREAEERSTPDHRPRRSGGATASRWRCCFATAGILPTPCPPSRPRPAQSPGRIATPSSPCAISTTRRPEHHSSGASMRRVRCTSNGAARRCSAASPVMILEDLAGGQQVDALPRSAAASSSRAPTRRSFCSSTCRLHLPQARSSGAAKPPRRTAT